MSIVERQREQIQMEVDQARQSARRAEIAAEAERSKYLWSKKNPNFALEANFQVMGEYLAQAGIQISEDALDLASRACRHQLAERPVEVPELTPEQKIQAENQRLKSLSPQELREEIRSGIKRKLATKEYGSYGAVYVPTFSAAEFLKMSPAEVKAILQYPGSNQERPVSGPGSINC